MSQEFNVEKDVPVPPIQHKGIPILTLEVGESILFPVAKLASVRSYASHLKRRKGMLFVTRRVDDENYRIWRDK